jgi:hypothetical protein
MRIRLAAATLALCAALVAATAWLLAWPLEKAVYLAPVIVAVAGVAVGLVVFWARVVWLELQKARRPRLWLGVAAALLALIGLLTALGISLPRE